METKIQTKVVFDTPELAQAFVTWYNERAPMHYLAEMTIHYSAEATVANHIFVTLTAENGEHNKTFVCCASAFRGGWEAANEVSRWLKAANEK